MRGPPKRRKEKGEKLSLFERHKFPEQLPVLLSTPAMNLMVQMFREDKICLFDGSEKSSGLD
jgi:hypothetical protein